MSKRDAGEDKSILLLCALYDERDALLDVLRSSTNLSYEPLIDGNTSVVDKSTGHVIAILSAFGNSGNTIAQEATSQLIRKYKPKLVILFGIAAGVEGRVNIGDVFLTSDVLDLRKGRIFRNRFGFIPESLPSTPGYTFPFSMQQLRKSLKNLYGEKINVYDDLHCGSSDNLIRNKKYMNAASKTNDKLGGVEMEAAGVASICRKRRIPFMIAKSITDHGDPEKCDKYRMLCCERVASSILYSIFPRFTTQTSQKLTDKLLIEARVINTGIGLLWPGVDTAGTNWMSVSDFEPKGLVVIPKFNPYKTKLPFPCRSIYESHLRVREEAEAKGTDYPFNGSRYRIIGIAAHDRRITDERVKVRITFGDSDYFSFLSTSRILDEVQTWPDWSTQTVREKYLNHIRDYPERVVSFLAHSFGLNILVVTSDRKAIMVKRSGRVALRTGMYHISANEGLRRSDGKYLFDQRSKSDPTPQIQKATIRGIEEELGIRLSPNQAKKICWTSLGLDPVGYQFALLGYIRVPQRSDEVIASASIARDRILEVKELIPVDFNAEAISVFIKRNSPWVAWGLECLYQALLSEANFEGEGKQSIIETFSTMRAQN